MIPVPLILVQLMLALGGALFVGNMAVVLRHRLARDKSRLPPPPPARRVALNVAVGAAVALWAVATLVVRY